MKKMVRISALILTLGILTTQSAFAAYSSYGTFSIKNDPVTQTTAGNMLGAGKTSTSSSFSVYASAKTMTSTPSVRLVNSSGAVRSSYVGVPNISIPYTGSNNTGTVGYNYYAEVKPALNQIGTDTIKLKFDPK